MLELKNGPSISQTVTMVKHLWRFDFKRNKKFDSLSWSSVVRYLYTRRDNCTVIVHEIRMYKSTIPIGSIYDKKNLLYSVPDLIY